MGSRGRGSGHRSEGCRLSGDEGSVAEVSRAIEGVGRGRRCAVWAVGVRVVGLLCMRIAVLQCRSVVGCVGRACTTAGCGVFRSVQWGMGRRCVQRGRFSEEGGVQDGGVVRGHQQGSVATAVVHHRTTRSACTVSTHE